MTNEPNPLAEAVPESMDELMSRDPLSYSKIDLEKIVGIFREQRKNWLLAEATGKKPKASPKTPKAPKASPKTPKAPKEVFTLDDLGL